MILLLERISWETVLAVLVFFSLTDLICYILLHTLIHIMGQIKIRPRQTKGSFDVRELSTLLNKTGHAEATAYLHKASATYSSLAGKCAPHFFSNRIASWWSFSTASIRGVLFSLYINESKTKSKLRWHKI